MSDAAPTLPPGEPASLDWDGTGNAPEAQPDVLESWDHPASGESPSLPTIRVQAGYLAQTIRECIHALGEHDENLFHRTGKLVRIVREPERREPYERDVRAGNTILTRPGTPRIVDAEGVLLERASMCARWERFDRRAGKGKAGDRSGAWVACDPDPTVIRAIEKRKEWPGIRPIRGIAETPYLAPSGRIVQKAGYDEETSTVLLPSCDVGPLIVTPSQAQARSALRYLWTEIACDFPFRGCGEPDAERDPDRVLAWKRAVDVPDAFVGVAMLLTMFARLAIDGAVPGGVFEAAGQGSGKSLQMHTIAMVSTGRAAGVATFPIRDGKPNEEELEKVIAGYALASARLIALDNIRGYLAGGTLEKAMTAVSTIDLRVLGSNNQLTLPWSAILLFSGNNMTMSDDVAQRSLVSRIESDREDPRSRPSSSFRHPNLLAWIRENRARCVRAALVILRAYLHARDIGESVPVFSRGSFEEWAALIPGAIVYAGGPNVLRAFPESGRGGDEETEAHSTLLRWWQDSWNDQRAAFILGALFKAERDEEHDGFDDVRSAIRALTRTREGATPSPHAFGVKLRALRGKPRDGLRIDAREDPKTKAQLWRVVKVGGG